MVLGQQAHDPPGTEVAPGSSRPWVSWTRFPQAVSGQPWSCHPDGPPSRAAPRPWSHEGCRAACKGPSWAWRGRAQCGKHTTRRVTCLRHVAWPPAPHGPMSVRTGQSRGSRGACRPGDTDVPADPAVAVGSRQQWGQGAGGQPTLPTAATQYPGREPGLPSARPLKAPRGLNSNPPLPSRAPCPLTGPARHPFLHPEGPVPLLLPLWPGR